ncbi:AMP-dependent synthetase/ligase [Nocardia sp. NPDC060249]|uniref:AMP-dependent synthetase/ligase n=1 Tax=Nocardia sp. NPDC060249 TaxID=3347082 RepID=UPI003647B50B
MSTTRRLPQLIAARAAATPTTVALREKQLGVWRQITWAEYDTRRRVVAHALAALGVGVGDRVGVLSDNRCEWLYADLGALSLRAASVGFYPTSPAAEVEHLLTDSGVKVLVVENQEQLDKAVAVWDRCPALETIVYLDGRGLADYTDERLLSWEQLYERGTAHLADNPDLLDEIASGTSDDDLATLVYTSGTTGPPKGAMLTVANIDFFLAKAGEGIGLFTTIPSERDVTLSYLPLCHVAERAFTVWYNAGHGVVVHFAESFDTISADLADVQPTVFFGVPRVWEKMQATVESKMASASPMKRLAWRISRRIGDRVATRRLDHGGAHTLSSRLWYSIAWVLVFRALRERLGLRRVRTALSAAAPISPEVLRFFLAMGVQVTEAYGMTENTALASSTRPGRQRLGTVGEVLDGIGLRLDPRTHEIQTRHAGNFAGYWGNPAATAEAFTEDGWLRTGDLGEWVGDSHLRLIGRSKDIMITAGGKNISPAEIENELKTSPFVNEAVVIGDARPYLAALIAIDYDVVADWASRHNLQYTTYHDLSGKPEVVELIRAAVLACNDKFARAEHIRKFRMLRKELDHEDGELTATRKVKRAAMITAYDSLIGDMYANTTDHAGGDLQSVHTEKADA